MAAGAETFSIGPLTMVAAVSDFEAWVGSAATGARIVYARGLVAPRHSATFVLAGELARAGRVTLVSKRCAEGTEWIAERVRTDGRGPTAAVSVDDADDVLERTLKRCARLSLPVPTNAQLATAAGLKDANAVKYRLRKLIERGAVRITDHGPNLPRTAQLVPTIGERAR